MRKLLEAWKTELEGRFSAEDTRSGWKLLSVISYQEVEMYLMLMILEKLEAIEVIEKKILDE